MRLLVCVQTVDTQHDPLLGFFHGWLVELSKHFETIEVICLKEGVHQLPQNVMVHSLGKEEGASRLKYVLRFYSHLLALRGKYDRVFVHMNPHYVILGGLYWKLQRIPVYFWRNHAQMNVMTRIAALFAKKIFYTSPSACTRIFSQSMQMPVGIDTTVFTPTYDAVHTPTPKKILFLGRLSPVKRVEVFIDAAALLTLGYEFHVYGDAPLQDKNYGLQLKRVAGTNVFFHPSVKSADTPKVYRAHDLYVNLTPAGSMDKTVLEAVACGTQALVANASFAEIVPKTSILSEVTAAQLATHIVGCVSIKKEEQEKSLRASRAGIVEKHSLEKLATMLYNAMQ